MQGATETEKHHPSDETTSELALIDFEASGLLGRGENLLPNLHEDNSQVHLQYQAESSQQAALAEKKIVARPTPALTPDPEGLRSDIAEFYWGKVRFKCSKCGEILSSFLLRVSLIYLYEL